MKEFEVDEICKDCYGTGLFVGFAERDGAAIVCHTCRGTGCHHVTFRYEPWEGVKKEREDIRWVFQTNPGIGIGEGRGHELKDFGGMPYKDWAAGKPFPPESEMRNFTCPAWWFQCVDYNKKPDWEDCSRMCGNEFSSCACFYAKERCWKRWDEEQKKETK